MIRLAPASRLKNVIWKHFAIFVSICPEWVVVDAPNRPSPFALDRCLVLADSGRLLSTQSGHSEFAIRSAKRYGTSTHSQAK